MRKVLASLALLAISAGTLQAQVSFLYMKYFYFREQG